MDAAKGQRPTKGKGKNKEKRRISQLNDLPENWWTPVNNDPGGYQMITETTLLGEKVLTLLDSGAGVNAVTKELVVGVTNQAWGSVLRIRSIQ